MRINFSLRATAGLSPEPPNSFVANLIANFVGEDIDKVSD